MLNTLIANLTLTLTTLSRYLDRRLAGSDRQAGFTTLEWAVIGSIAFAMAVAIGAGLSAVANNYLGKIS